LILREVNEELSALLVEDNTLETGIRRTKKTNNAKSYERRLYESKN